LIFFCRERAATIVKVQVDNGSELASQFGIRSIPALLLFKGVIDINTD